MTETTRYKCPNGHVWNMRNPLMRGAYRGFLSSPWLVGRAWRWAFCPECGMAAENPEYARQREPIKDKHGCILAPGDIVEFYFAAWPVLSEPTRMVDIVERHDGWLYFMHPEIGRGALATEHAWRCIRLGSISELANAKFQVELGPTAYRDIECYLGRRTEPCKKS